MKTAFMKTKLSETAARFLNLIESDDRVLNSYKLFLIRQITEDHKSGILMKTGLETAFRAVREFLNDDFFLEANSEGEAYRGLLRAAFADRDADENASFSEVERGFLHLSPANFRQYLKDISMTPEELLDYNQSLGYSLY